MAKSKQAKESEIAGYRYKCTRTCFFGGKRVFAGERYVSEEPLGPRQAGFFDLIEVIHAGPRSVAADAGEEGERDNESDEA